MVGLAVHDLNFLEGHQLIGWYLESRGAFSSSSQSLLCSSLPFPVSPSFLVSTVFAFLEIKHERISFSVMFPSTYKTQIA